MNSSFDNRFIEKLTQLEMLRPADELMSLFFVADKKTAPPRIRFLLEQAEDYKANAVFFRVFPDAQNRSPLPQIFVYSDNVVSLDENRFAHIHRRLWNSGIVPLAFILTATQVTVLNCREEPKFDTERGEILFTPFRKLEKLLEADRAFLARAISNGTFWEDPKFKDDFSLEKTAYYKILEHLKIFRQKLIKQKILSEPAVNRILVLAILVKYLSDRRDSKGNCVFKKGFLADFPHIDSENIELLFRRLGDCIHLFDHLSKHFNGGIFELCSSERSELKEANLAPIADFLKGDKEPNGQMLFWPLYSFQDLPIELISNIYEVFLATHDKENSKGVVYTPPMLVDLLLDQCLPLSPEILSWKILDPACGSGVFLVGAFRRLIQCWRMGNGWNKPSHLELKSILKNNLFGFDKAPEAVLIAVFSLCVALCDELDPLVIWNKLKFDNLQERNLHAQDFFGILEKGSFDGFFDLIIGNPPFESDLTTDAAARIEKNAKTERGDLPDKQLGLLFLEQSFRMAKKEATVCLIQPAGPLLYNGGSLPFRNHLFESFAIDQVFDFTALEGVLFRDKKVASAAVIGCNVPPSNEKILHLTFRRTKTIKEKIFFELDPYDFHWVSRKLEKKTQYAWKANLLGGGRLHRLLDRLFSDFTTLGKYLEEKKKNHRWQFGEGYSIGSGNKLNAQADAKELVDLLPEELRSRFKLKRIPKLAPWITGKRNVPPEALSKEGIDWDSVKICGELFFQERSSSIKSIFIPPHVLIREVVSGNSIPTVFSEEELVFSKQIVGVHAPAKEKKCLLQLAERLNDSGLYGILAAIVSGRMLVGRKSSLLKTDIMALPYPDEGKEIELNFWEQALIEDIKNYLIEFQNGGENATVLAPTDECDLQNFGEMYCRILNPVYKQFQPLPPIPIGSFFCYPFCYGKAPNVELPDKSGIVSFLEELLHRQHSSRLFMNRILRLYDQNVIFMVKPDQKRYWLRSIAMRDADETFVDLLEQGF